MSLEIFHYCARTREGEITEGVVRARSDTEAAVDLKRRALFATSITRRSRAPFRFRTALRRRSSTQSFFRAFSTLIRAGIPMRRALSVTIEYCTDRPFREALRGVLTDVEHGSSLSTALSRRPREFSTLQTAMIGAGEAGGVLDEVLDRLTTLGDREHALHKRLQSALVYPCVVSLSAGGLILFILIHVAPMFASMFERFGAPLPVPTQILLTARSFVVSPWSVTVVAAMIVTLIGGAPIFDRVLGHGERMRLYAPVAGAIVRKAIVSRVARMFSALLQSGVGALDAINVVAPATGSQVYAKVLVQIGDALRRGETLHQAMIASRLFDPLTLALAAVGEESGSLDSMLRAAADHLDIEVEAALTALAAFLEPALIGFLGLIVAAIVFAIFLPLYGLIGSIS